MNEEYRPDVEGLGNQILRTTVWFSRFGEVGMLPLHPTTPSHRLEGRQAQCQHSCKMRAYCSRSRLVATMTITNSCIPK